MSYFRICSHVYVLYGFSEMQRVHITCNKTMKLYIQDQIHEELESVPTFPPWMLINFLLTKFVVESFLHLNINELYFLWSVKICHKNCFAQLNIFAFLSCFLFCLMQKLACCKVLRLECCFVLFGAGKALVFCLCCMF